ncbi:SDR family NAD(P)-dependent oxidoreductase [Azospirillum brasilense]|uniref:SDR family NAD(P)-dependent oxidoreductase n=1 Tax=Azospirillum brasilense TaxID=192 RepID=A0A6L3AS16_AZOBR|nr:SDR family NAD(P)-dependent oxidoreductase [Azospirillum brasilense]KAA0677440.1 SDR family NAD(P)-dependent oxidoreductase [Azospirillum brasilense]
MTTLIVGASAGLGRALGRALARHGHSRLILVARDPRDLDAEAAHLRHVHGCDVRTVTADATDLAALVAGIRSAVPPDAPVRHILFPIGASRSDDDGRIPPKALQGLVTTNLTAVMATVQSLLPDLLAAESADVVGFGSIAAIRGRGANMAYAAAKRGLESYFESLRHKTARSGVHIQFYRLGYLDTQQAFGKKLLFPVASPDAIAERVVGNLGRDLGTVTLPAFWRLVGLLVRALPWAFYKRTAF